MKKMSVVAACAWALTANSMAWSQTQPASPAASKSRLAQAERTSALAHAEVISVYPKEKRVLLRHGPIASLGMSDMTMEFGVARRSMLRSFRPGTQVKFSAALVDGDYVVTHVEAAR